MVEPGSGLGATADFPGFPKLYSPRTHHAFPSGGSRRQV